ncbi:hypothetical protein [Frankia sp. Cppng1_Ct_nod]|uniref:hypothetical protein n=1 Tax=Frankia sp. Cppng1_Ct_nod TaxID=2897162 RepID=UPI0020248435|nr:hypothetical protein [Frankia sp. Cppng1_Ct_nod]
MTSTRAAGIRRNPAITSAVASHDAVMARAAVLFRVLTGALGLAQLVIWWPWFCAHPWTIAGPLTSTGWAVLAAAVIARHGLDPRLSTLELALAGPLGCCGGLLVPPSTVGDGANWVFITLGGITVTSAWCLPVRTAVPAVGSVAAAYWAGAALVGPSGPAPGVPVRSVVLLAVVTTAWAVAVRTCHGRAVDADIRLVASVRQYRVALIARARVRDRREQERLVHDTVVNTLTGIAMNGMIRGDSDHGDDVRRRCAGDLSVLETFLARGPSLEDDPDDPEVSGSSGRASLAREGGRLLRTGYATGVTLGVATFAVCWHVAMVLPAVTMTDRYRWPLVSVGVWVALAGVAAAALPVSIRRRLRGRECLGLVSAAVLAELLVGLACRGYNVVGFANWALLGTGWLLIIIAVNRPAHEAFLGAAAVTVMATALSMHEVGPAALALSRLVAAIWGLWVGPLAVVVVRRALVIASLTTARTVATNADLSAMEISAEAVRTDRFRRWDVLTTHALPLLRAIADGLLDPSDAAVRTRCATQAATLRRMLGGTTTPDLERVIAAAERRGLQVETQLSGDLRHVPADARVAIARVVEKFLTAVTTGPVLLTVLGGTDEAHVFMSFPAPPDDVRAAGATRATPVIPAHRDLDRHSDDQPDDQLDVVTDLADGRSCLQLRWSRPPTGGGV